MNSSGQISLEALLLWAGLASSMAFFLPIFSQVMHAQALLVHVRMVDSLGAEVSHSINELSFLAEGSVRIVKIPSITNASIEIFPQGMVLFLEDDSFLLPKEWRIESPVPLEGNPSFNKKEWVFTRTENGIGVQ